MGLFAQTPDRALKVVRLLFPFLVFVVIIFLSVSSTVRAKDVASRQQMSLGIVTECEEHKGRYCHYVFSGSDGEPREGYSEASSHFALGQTVTVYYDSENPRTSALEDFAKRCRSDELLVGGETIVLLLLMAYVFSQRHRLLGLR